VPDASNETPMMEVDNPRTIGSIPNPQPKATANDTLDRALKMFAETDLLALPVVNNLKSAWALE
jgi:hypothetical protein